jgi:hypothetical protein
VTQFSEGVQQLKLFEYHSGLHTKDHVSLFNLLSELLFERNQFVKDLDLWEEIYMRSLCFYKFKTHIGSIPITLVTKHNEILPFYMKQMAKKDKDVTFLRFDTHSDLNPIKDSSMLKGLYKKYKKTHSDTYIKKAQDIVWDIGAAKSGVLLTVGIKDLIWGFPAWVFDRETRHGLFIKKGFLYTDEEDTIFNDKLPSETDVVKQFSKIQIGNVKKYSKNIKKDVDMIKINGTTYVLDIDLDYFVSNGEKRNRKEQLKELFDVQSFNRTKTIVLNENVPRKKIQNTSEFIKFNKDIRREKRLIDKRLTHFFKIITSLKKKGYTPCMISVCDSTNILFQDCQTCNSISNGYVPVYFAFYIHTKVMSGLTQLFE